MLKFRKMVPQQISLEVIDQMVWKMPLILNQAKSACMSISPYLDALQNAYDPCGSGQV